MSIRTAIEINHDYYDKQSQGREKDADPDTQAAFEMWNAGAAYVARMATGHASG
jgi:hypothetical protein